MRISFELQMSIRCQAMIKLGKGNKDLTITGPKGLLVTKTAEQWNEIINKHLFKEVLNANTIQTPHPVRLIKLSGLPTNSNGHPILRRF